MLVKERGDLGFRCENGNGHPWFILERQAESGPGAAGRAGGEEGGVADGELAVDGREGAGDEVAVVGEAGGAELGGGVVTLVEEVVDVGEEGELGVVRSSTRLVICWAGMMSAKFPARSKILLVSPW